MIKHRKLLIGASIALVLVFTAVVLLVYLNRVEKYRDTVEQMIMVDVDLSKVPDGTYQGECDVNLIYVKVAVTVKDGTIQKIDLLHHENGRGAPAEVIPDRIIEQQKTVVDTVSSATNSSKVIMKAVQNALLELNRKT